MSLSDLEQLQDAVVRCRPELMGFVRAHAGALLLRFETAEDLVQNVTCGALASAEGFSFASDDETRAWLFRIARRHLADRRRHWSALKRGSGRVLRLHLSGSGSSAGGEPPAEQTTPSLFALRREQLALAARVLDVLSERDRQLVRGSAAGLELAELAEATGLSYEAVAKARARALERFRKGYEVLRRSREQG